MIEETQQDMAKAQVAFWKEEERIETAGAEVEELTAKLSAADDTDSRAFAHLAQEVGAARARLDAIAARRDRAAAELENARRALAEAQRLENAVELKRIEAEIVATTDALGTSCKDFGLRLTAQIARLHELFRRSVELGGAGGLGCAWIAGGRPLQLADQIVGADATLTVAPPPWSDPSAPPSEWIS